MRGREQKQRSLLETMNRALGVDCYRSDFSELLSRVGDLDSASRLHVITLCERAFAESRFRRHEPTRVAAARLLVALLPESTLVIQRWLQKKRPQSIYEVHFSLFCHLDEVQHFESLESAKQVVLKLVATYLMESKGDKAQAGWMAADLLGDHWELSESLSLLLNVAKNAKAPAARVEAVNGLAKALPRCSAKERLHVRNNLESLVKHDQSRAVRFAATACLNETL